MPIKTSPSASEFLKQHFSRWWAIFLASLGILYLFYKIAVPLGDLLTNWLLGHEAVLKGTISIDGFATAFLVGCSFLLFALVVFSAYSVYSLILAHRLASQALKVPVLTKTFERTVQAADRIAKQLFPGAATATKKVVSCKQVYTLYKNGDCHASETLVVAAHEKDVHFFEKNIGVEPEADPADFPDEIDLKVTSRTANREVAYLISRNEGRLKNVMVFFLPRIQDVVDDELEVKKTFFLNRFFNLLITHGEEPFETTIKTVVAIPRVEYEFWVAPDAGYLTCQNVGQMIDETDAERETLIEIADPDTRGMRGWKYTAINFPIGHTTRFRLTWKKS
jgi:hypothetical protein